MKTSKLLCVGVISGGLLLGGCATTKESAQSLAQKAIEATVAVCGFLPTIDTVTSIILAGNPAYTTASAIANGICAAVTSRQVSPTTGRRATPIVAGVVIHGKFVPK